MDIQFSGRTAHISGTIDENADFSSILKLNSPITLDLSGVIMANSLGIRGWLKFLFDWGNRAPLTYDKCSVPIVDQLVILDSLTKPKGHLIEIISFYVPTECSSCSFSAEVLVSYADFQRVKSINPLLPECVVCGSPQHCNSHGHQNLIR